jgi:hemerythrin-like domain-containing protein
MNQFVMHGSFFAHRALMRDAEMLNTIALRIERLSQEELHLLNRWYDFFWNMMEAHHAAEDDLLFRAVEKKMEQPSETIEEMEVEHNRIQFLIDEIKRVIGELERTDKKVLLCKELQLHTDALLNVFNAHIMKEEAYILEKMKAHFTINEQRKIENEVKRKAPVRYLSYMVPWLHDSLSVEENKILDQSLPWTAKLMNRFFWKNNYTRLLSPVKTLLELHPHVLERS